MATNIGPKIGIEGESQYRKELQNIINDTKVLNSEMKALTASFDKENISVKQNSQQKELLEKQIQATTEKLKLQEDMLKKAAEATDQNGVHTDELAQKEKQWQMVVNNTRAELNKMQQQLNDMPSSFDILASKMKKIGEDMKSFGESVSKVGDTLTKTLSLPILGAATIGINYNAQLEQYQTMFTTLTGSAEEADKIIKQLQSDASKSPFDTASLIEANQYLISAGVSADESRQTILDLGNAIAATGGGSAELSRMAQNMQQIKNLGKASAMDIKQFANAGINIYGLLAEATGKTTEEVKDMEVSYELLTEALSKASQEGGKYAGAMENQSQTLNGSVSALKESIQQLLGDLTAELLPIIKDVLEIIKEWVQKVKEMDPEQKKMISRIAGIVAAIGPVVSIVGKVITFIGTITTAISSLGPIIAAVKAAIIAITGAVSGAIAPILAIIAGIAALIAIIKNWGEISEWFKTTWENVKENVVTAFNNMKSSAINAFNNMLSGISGIVSNIKNTIVNGISNAVSYISDQVSKAWNWGSDLIGNFVSGIKSKISAVTDAVSAVATKVRNYLHFSEPDIGPLSDFHTWMPDMMKGLATGIDQNMYLIDDAVSRVASALEMDRSSADNSINYNGGITINLNVADEESGEDIVDRIESAIAMRSFRRKAVF